MYINWYRRSEAGLFSFFSLQSRSPWLNRQYRLQWGSSPGHLPATKSGQLFPQGETGCAGFCSGSFPFCSMVLPPGNIMVISQ